MAALDRQSAAYREAKPEDLWPDDVDSLVEEGGIIHPPDLDVGSIRLPEAYEEDEWDTGKERPKTLDEAKAELAKRIADQSAPDSKDHAKAYDKVGED